MEPIKINDKYSFKRGADTWDLYESVGKKNGMRKTYHANLNQLFKKLLSDGVIECETIHEVIEHFNLCVEQIDSCLEGYSIDQRVRG